MKNKKDILIISNFCMDFSKTDNDRFLYIAKKLQERHNIEIVTSDFYHTNKKKRKVTLDKWPFKVTFLNEPGYKKNVCFKRFYSHYIWGKNIKKYLSQRKKPDIIYCAVPSLTGALEASKYCKKNKIKFIIDIQDLWPEAFKMVFNMPLISDIVFFPFNLIANKIYKSADDICSVSQTYLSRALKNNKKCEAGYVAFLGTNLADFDINAKQHPILQKKNKDEFWIGYCGTLGSSYDLFCIFDALNVLGKENESIRFIIMGDGPLKRKFEAYAGKLDINVSFLGRLDYDKMCSELKQCDITVNPISQRAAQSIINKHADYAAAGIPVINTQENSEYRKLVEDYNMGFNCSRNNIEDIANKILILKENENLRDLMGKNARKCAEEKFNREASYCEIFDLLDN